MTRSLVWLGFLLDMRPCTAMSLRPYVRCQPGGGISASLICLSGRDKAGGAVLELLPALCRPPFRFRRGLKPPAPREEARSGTFDTPYLSSHEPGRPHPQRLLDEVTQPDLAGALQPGLPSLHPDPVRMIEALHKAIRNTDKGEN